MSDIEIERTIITYDNQKYVLIVGLGSQNNLPYITLYGNNSLPILDKWLDHFIQYRSSNSNRLLLDNGLPSPLVDKVIEKALKIVEPYRSFV